MNVTGGDTDVTTYFTLRLAADGIAATGLTLTDFDLQYVRSGVAPSAKVDIAAALAATDSAHEDNKGIEIDATDQPGLYRIDWPDAAFAAGVPEVILTVKVATAFTEHLAVQIDPPVNVTKWLGTACATPTVAGVPEVDLTHIGGGAQSALDLKDFADDGYDPATDKVQGVVLVDTTSVNTDMVGTDGANTTVPDAAGTAATLLGTAGASLTDLGGMSTGMKAEVQVEANDALIDNNLDHLAKTATVAADMTAEVADNTILSRVLANGDTSAFVPSTDGLQAIRDVAPHGSTMVGTDSAALASVCTETRLAELDPANLPADVDAVLLDTGTDGVKLATGAVTAAVVATDAIDADALAADAVTEIQSGLATSSALVTHDGKLDTVDTNVDTILLDTNELQTNQGNWLTATGFSTHNAAAVWEIATSGLTTVGSIGKLIVDYLDAAITSRNSVVPPTEAQMNARTVVSVDYATSANQTTILARIGSWSGSGVNTLLGAFKALLSKAASAPSDIGGTFDPAADSTEAIRDRGDVAWIPGGSGVNVTQIGGVTLDDKVGSNLDLFFQNSDADTTKVVDNVGTAGGAGDYTYDHSTDTLAQCWVYTTSAMTTLILYDQADESGDVTFRFQSTGTYYVRHYKQGLTYPNDPEAIVVT